MREKTKRKIKNALIKASAFAAGFAWALAACCADSESIWPLRIIVASTVWLALLYLANFER